MACCNGKSKPMEPAIPITEPKYVTADIPEVPKNVTPETRSENNGKTGGSKKAEVWADILNEVPEYGTTREVIATSVEADSESDPATI